MNFSIVIISIIVIFWILVIANLFFTGLDTILSKSAEIIKSVKYDIHCWIDSKIVDSWTKDNKNLLKVSKNSVSFKMK